MPSPPHHRARQALVRRLAEVRRRSPDGATVTGHHNSNHIVSLGQPLAFLLGMGSGRVLAKFRTPFTTVEVVPRIWRRESEVLRAVSKQLSEVPRCLVDFEEWSLHAYLPGRVLSEVVQEGPIGSWRLAALADFFARVASVPEYDLPQRPADWPQNGDSSGFLRWLGRFAEQRVYQCNRPRFGELFDAVGVPRDAVDRFLRSVPELSPRPFALLHTDVHRANVVVIPDGDGERLSVIDWELALYGDPLHDLATHLVRMGYDKTEQELMIRMWADAMRSAGHGDMTVDMDRDLEWYLGFEYVQSVFPDVMRAALALPDDPGEQDLRLAAGQVCRAIHRAREPLALVDGPLGEEAGVEALRQWHRADRAEWVGSTEELERMEGLERHGC
ncbi:phosphotransferase family protein [Streptomyces sp. NBC_00258]|uniref:phosphotransferase family protein n=1 Tax=Streptomyces sp. NBC_00258 TaxID=2903642 RepID=UPI002E283E26|nr:aminoglycoside phosphotransferase family protein [Streptomyces sp. NBC_00258]